MRNNTSYNKSYVGKAAPKIVDAVRFNNRYVDLDTIKEKATGLLSATLIIAGLVAFSFLFFMQF